MPAYLKPAGYVTAWVGKWGQLPLGPGEFGFDEQLKLTGRGVEGDEMHAFLADFIGRQRAYPFYVYYCLSNLQKPIVPTPDSKPGNTDLYTDNIRYMDNWWASLWLNSNARSYGTTPSSFFRATTAPAACMRRIDDRRTAIGRRKGVDAGRRCAGAVDRQLAGQDSGGQSLRRPGGFNRLCCDLAELAGVKLPENKVLDGHSFAPQLLGHGGNSAIGSSSSWAGNGMWSSGGS